MRLHKSYPERGFSLLMVMALTGIAILLLSGALQWSSAGSHLTGRNNDYYSALATVRGAEARKGQAVAFDIEPYGKRRVLDDIP